MRIAHLIPTLDPGGAEKVAVTLANGFTGRGYQVDLLAKRTAGAWRSELDPRVDLYDLQAPRTFALLTPLMDYLRQREPNVLISHLELTNLIATLAKRLSRSRVKLICVSHSSISTQESVLGPKWLERRVLSAVQTPDIVRVVVSHDAACDYAQYFNIPTDNLHVIYNPVIGEDFASKAAEPCDHPWFEPGQHPIVLFTGRLDPVKNIPIILQAVRQVNEIRPLRLLILGEGPEREAIERQIEVLHLQDKVQLLGHVPNPLPYMRQANLLALASNREGFSLVLVEAMACGCPVVSTDCPHGPNELLNGGRYGHLVPVGDASAMAYAMVAILAGDTRIAPQTWLKQFETAAILDQYQALF